MVLLASDSETTRKRSLEDARRRRFSVAENGSAAKETDHPSFNNRELSGEKSQRSLADQSGTNGYGKNPHENGRAHNESVSYRGTKSDYYGRNFVKQDAHNVNKDANESRMRDALQRRRDYFRGGASNAGKRSIGKRSRMGAAKKNLSMASDLTKDAAVLSSTLVNPMNFFSLMGQIDLLKDFPYIVALIATGFDDMVIDWSGLTDILPGLGSVISTCLNIFVGFMYLLATAAEGGDMSTMKRKALRRLGLLVASTAVELIPILDILPTEFLVALVIYAFLLAERKRRRDGYKKQSRIYSRAGKEREERTGVEETQELKKAA